MKHIIHILAILLLVSCQGEGGNETAQPDGHADQPQAVATQALMQSLDSALTQFEQFERDKHAEIAHLRANLASASDPEQRYLRINDLYEAYSTFDSDSALVYAERGLAVARQTGRQNWTNDMLLNQVYVCAATGILDRADRILNDIDTLSLTPRQQLRYNEQVLYLYTHRDQYLNASAVHYPHGTKADAMLDRVCADISSDDPLYGWFIGWRGMRSPAQAREVIPVLERRVAHSAVATRQDAMELWVLSRLYETVGDRDRMLHYLSLSALADMRSCNKEIASLEEIANLLYQDRSNTDNLKRANDYISHCIRCANEYKSRVRVGRLAQLQHAIAGQYQQQLRQQERRVVYSFWMLAGCFVILLGALVLNVTQKRKLSATRTLLSDSNAALNRTVAELQQSQEQLQLANSQLEELYVGAQRDAKALADTNLLKEKYIADIFSICSGYISKLDAFRKNMHRLLISGKHDQLQQLTKSPELSQAEAKELHQTFDKVFLGIYPDFVEAFNSLLRPDERITPRQPGHLNTELRIYALIRLGLTDSGAIASFLHCSVQTVYNTRQRTRAKASGDRHDFDRQVRELGIRRNA